MATWADGTTATILDTGLNSLANGAGVLSAAIDNDADLDLYIDIEVYVAGYGASINKGVKVADVYLVPTLDGTNYADTDSSVPQARYLVGSVTKGTANGTGATRDIIQGVPLPPRDYKLAVVNTSGQAWAASGNTLKVRPYSTQ